APQHEQPLIQEMIDALRDKWMSLCNGAVDRQRNLEEALLLSGQFKEAVAALMDWLDTSALPSLEGEERVHGDLDTVNRLIDQHKAFQTELKGRAANVATVRKAAQELLAAGDNEGTADIRTQMADLDDKWTNLNQLTEQRGERLQDALKEAEKLHKSAHTLLEWLSDMESKLKFAGALPDNETELEQQLARLEVLNQEMASQRPMLDDTLSLARDIQTKCHPLAEQPIKHWLRILQARWDEVAAWSDQRNDRLKEQLKTVTDQDALIDDLLKWIQGKENELHDVEEVPVPEDLEVIEEMIADHEEFEGELRDRQGDVDDATKGRKR
uniref:DMD n=1 Tax=Plectus sambesii TaxID=2011161 RepID=A0A914V858_9BILA